MSSQPSVMSGCDNPQQGGQNCDLTAPSGSREPQTTRKVLGSISINIVSSSVQDGNENGPTSSNALSIDIGTFTSSSGCTIVDTGRKSLKRTAEDACLETPNYEMLKEPRRGIENFSFEDKDRIFKSFAAEEEAKLLLCGSKKNYPLSMSKLQDICPSGALSELAKKFMMLECAVHLGSDSASKVINDAAQAIMALSQDDKRLGDLAKLYGSHRYPLKAIIMHRCACKSSSIARKKNDACDSIVRTIGYATKVIKMLSKRTSQEGMVCPRDIAMVHGMPLIKDMLSDLRGVIARHKMKHGNFEGVCLGRIASAYNDLNEHQEAIKLCEEGLEIMKKFSGEGMGQNHACIQLLENLGLAHRALGNKEDAIECFEQCTKLRGLKGCNPEEKANQVTKKYLEELRCMGEVKSESQV